MFHIHTEILLQRLFTTFAARFGNCKYSNFNFRLWTIQIKSHGKQTRNAMSDRVRILSVVSSCWRELLDARAIRISFSQVLFEDLVSAFLGRIDTSFTTKSMFHIHTEILLQRLFTTCAARFGNCKYCNSNFRLWTIQIKSHGKQTRDAMSDRVRILSVVSSCWRELLDARTVRISFSQVLLEDLVSAFL